MEKILFKNQSGLTGCLPLMGVYSVVAPLVFFLLGIFLTGSLCLAKPACAASFSDIAGHWAAPVITQAVTDGLIKGYPDGTFKPDRGVTRAEFVAMINSAFQVPKSGRTLPPFKDVKSSDWFAPAVTAVVDAGYVNGYPDGTFRPQQAITRQEAATLLAGLLRLEDGGKLDFSDAGQIGDWARPGVAGLVAKGLISGYPDGSFRPGRTITRAEAAVIVNNARGMMSSTPVSVYLIVNADLVNIRTGPGTDYDLCGQVRDGDVLKAAARSDNNWYQVEIQGGTGWIAGWLVQVSETEPPSRGDPGSLDVQVQPQDDGVMVVLTAGKNTAYQWEEKTDPQRLVVTAPGVTVLRTPAEITAGMAGLDSVRTSALTDRQGTALVELAFSRQPVPVFYRVEGDASGVLRVWIPHQINQVETAAWEDGVAITLRGAAPLNVRSFKLSDPKRIVFDFSGFALHPVLLNWEKSLSQAAFRTARLGQFQDGLARLVVEVTQGVSFTVEKRSGGRELILRLKPASLDSMCVVIDPGHGGSEPGAVGPSGVKEKDVNMAIAGEAARILQQQGINVILTRDGDYDVGLIARADLANSCNADIFVSIHANGSTNPEIGGTATYVIEKTEALRSLAESLQAELAQALGLRDAGVFEGNLSVLRNTNMPGALVEVAFLSNSAEEQLLTNPDFQNRAAQAIVRGIIGYLMD